MAGEQVYLPQTHAPAQAVVEAEEVLHKSPADGSDQPDTESVVPLIELIVQVRTQLRAAKQWALADEIRGRLSEMGIILEDGAKETTWRKG